MHFESSILKDGLEDFGMKACISEHGLARCLGAHPGWCAMTCVSLVRFGGE